MTYREYLEQENLIPLVTLLLKSFPMTSYSRKLLKEILEQEVGNLEITNADGEPSSSMKSENELPSDISL